MLPEKLDDDVNDYTVAELLQTIKKDATLKALLASADTPKTIYFVTIVMAQMEKLFQVSYPILGLIRNN